MPNWCRNTIVVSGKSEDLDFFEKIKFDFEKILPTPAELNAPENKVVNQIFKGEFKDTTEVYKDHDLSCLDEEQTKTAKYLIDKYGSCGWYSWRCDNWGTKWTAKDIVFERKDTTHLSIDFETPWNPPVPILKHLTKIFDVKILLTCFVEMIYRVWEVPFENGEMLEPKLISEFVREDLY